MLNAKNQNEKPNRKHTLCNVLDSQALETETYLNTLLLRIVMMNG